MSTLVARLGVREKFGYVSLVDDTRSVGGKMSTPLTQGSSKTVLTLAWQGRVREVNPQGSGGYIP